MLSACLWWPKMRRYHRLSSRFESPDRHGVRVGSDRSSCRSTLTALDRQHSQGRGAPSIADKLKGQHWSERSDTKAGLASVSFNPVRPGRIDRCRRTDRRTDPAHRTRPEVPRVTQDLCSTTSRKGFPQVRPRIRLIRDRFQSRPARSCGKAPSR